MVIVFDGDGLLVDRLLGDCLLGNKSLLGNDKLLSQLIDQQLSFTVFLRPPLDALLAEV